MSSKSLSVILLLLIAFISSVGRSSAFAAKVSDICARFSAPLYIAEYDHAKWWWNASDDKTVALYNPELFNLDPKLDNSLQFFDVKSAPKQAKIPELIYQDFILARGLTMQRPPLDGENYVITGDEKYHKFESGMGDFAWDIVKINERGERFIGTGKQNADYLVWGESVYSPVTGVVFQVLRDQVDQIPGPADLQAKDKNNLVGIYLGGGYYVYLLHFQQYSIPEKLKPGTRIQAGEFLGLVGNSGVSEEPHLHMTLMYWDRVRNRMWSVPSGFTHVAVKGSSGLFEATKFINPREGTVLKNLRHSFPRNIIH